jgi:hypothetical protein
MWLLYYRHDEGIRVYGAAVDSRKTIFIGQLSEDNIFP